MASQLELKETNIQEKSYLLYLSVSVGQKVKEVWDKR